MVDLLAQGVYESAEIMGNFLLSGMKASPSVSPSVRVKYLMTYSQALVGQEEYVRAISYYRQALQNCELYRNVDGAMAETEAKIKFEVAKCHVKLNSPRAALAELETVSSRYRTLPLLLTLAKLYRINGYERASTSTYRECLRLCPFAVEAWISLAELGMKAEELSGILAQHFPSASDQSKQQLIASKGSSGVGSSESTRKKDKRWEPSTWIPHLVSCHQFKYADETSKSVEMVKGFINNVFPNNVHLLLELAHSHSTSGNFREAITCFQHARNVDNACVKKMDHYAFALNATHNVVELNRLTHDLLRIDNRKPETWVSASLYWDGKGDRLRALSYAEKGLRLDDTHAMLHLLKGNLCLKLNRPDSAVNAFRKAQTLQPNISAFEGLTRAYTAYGKHKEALVTAREAVRLMPSSTKAMLLLGNVYAKQSESRDRAMKIFEGILRSSPRCKEAILSKIDIHVANRNLVAAEHTLTKHLETHVNDDLHTRLAGILMESQKYGQATEHYHIALSLNEANEEAQTGLERLEKLMKGIDPDMVTDDEIDDNGQVDGANVDEESEFV
jgi:anaphase-promoting complex subunit 7